MFGFSAPLRLRPLESTGETVPKWGHEKPAQLNRLRPFRREFGLTPGEARERSLRTSNAPPDDRPAEPRPDAEAARWVANLTGAIPQLSALRVERRP